MYSYIRYLFSEPVLSHLTLTAVAEAVLDQDAGVFDYEKAGGAGFGCGVLVFDSLLHPDYFAPTAMALSTTGGMFSERRKMSTISMGCDFGMSSRRG